MAAPVASRPAITSVQLREWMERRRRTRRKVIAVFLTTLSIGAAGVAVVWSIFHRHLLAQSHLQRRGFLVDWEISLSNLSTGGTTAVSYRPDYYQRDQRVSAGDLESLKAINHLRALYLPALDLLGDDELAVISELHELEDLDLERTTSIYQTQPARPLLTNRVLDHVRVLTRLKTLGLASNRITDAGLKKLANLRALQSLDLDGTAVTDAGLDALAGLKALKMLRIENTRVTAEGLARFQQKRPDIEVFHESTPMAPGVMTR